MIEMMMRYPPAMDIHYLLLTCQCGVDWSLVGSVMSGVGAVVSAVIAGVGLYWLIRYARDTKVIAEASQDQIEGLEVPFVVISAIGPGDALEGKAMLALRNLGKGPAINTRLAIRQPQSLVDVKVPAVWVDSRLAFDEIGVEDKMPLSILTTRAIEHGNDFTLEYESLSRRKYRSVCKNDGGTWSTAFERLGRQR